VIRRAPRSTADASWMVKGGITSRTLPVTGQYTSVVDPSWPYTGTAVLRLHS
jgi:hypothetical protein